jgi:hypothetical protein
MKVMPQNSTPAGKQMKCVNGRIVAGVQMMFSSSMGSSGIKIGKTISSTGRANSDVDHSDTCCGDGSIVLTGCYGEN